MLSPHACTRRASHLASFCTGAAVRLALKLLLKHLKVLGYLVSSRPSVLPVQIALRDRDDLGAGVGLDDAHSCAVIALGLDLGVRENTLRRDGGADDKVSASTRAS